MTKGRISTIPQAIFSFAMHGSKKHVQYIGHIVHHICYLDYAEYTAADRWCSSHVMLIQSQSMAQSVDHMPR